MKNLLFKICFIIRIKNYVATRIKNPCQLINVLIRYSIQPEMTSHAKIWCIFIPHMRLKAKLHDTVFIIQSCAGKGGRNQNITANEVLLKGLELNITDQNLFWYIILVFHYHMTYQLTDHTTTTQVLSIGWRLHLSHKKKKNFLHFTEVPFVKMMLITAIWCHKLWQGNRQILKVLEARTHDPDTWTGNFFSLL